jgi:hypothetical protein
MACDITSGFTLGCRDNVGSIKQIYILSGSVTSVTDASEGLINAISGSGVFYTFELFRETSDYSENVTVAPRKRNSRLRTNSKRCILQNADFYSQPN